MVRERGIEGAVKGRRARGKKNAEKVRKFHEAQAPSVTGDRKVNST